ncbi:MAG TPA: hypothetical protein VNN99_10880 [Vicinamibacterales bacterium]|nr:hypothetical protein [Vicinamibacterales bacterium]
MPRPTVVAHASLAVLIALYVVGAVSVPPGSLRHEVQTLPLWIPIVAGYRGRPIAKWAALPWLAIMIAIWLYLLGIARIVTGRFFPTEVAMTLVVGAAAAIALGACARWKTTTSLPAVAITLLAMTALQLLAFRISLIPYIGQR